MNLYEILRRLEKQDVRHKVFLSFYHHDDEWYKTRFEALFGHLFISKSVKPGDIDTDLSTEYIKRLIREGYISDASVLVVLVGAKTYCRKHVDWEISAALSGKAAGHSGLLGLLLPTRFDFNSSYVDFQTVPPRLVDNLRSGYARLYKWAEDAGLIRHWVEDAFNARISRCHMINNSRPQYVYNRCE